MAALAIFRTGELHDLFAHRHAVVERGLVEGLRLRWWLEGAADDTAREKHAAMDRRARGFVGKCGEQIRVREHTGTLAGGCGHACELAGCRQAGRCGQAVECGEAIVGEKIVGAKQVAKIGVLAPHDVVNKRAE